ncbi:MAG: beta-lactamase family protein [Gemmatimonadaceae bacterium]|nr:beta-lactamase family protein [Gemmatimonadaceae bacterium]
MRKLSLLVPCLFSFVSLELRAQPATPVVTPAVLSAADMNTLGVYVDSLSRMHLFSGVVLVAKRDSVMFQRAYGIARRELDIPNRLTTRFVGASIGKVLTATAILQLVQDGKMALDDPIAKHAPELLRDSVGRLVQVRHLLSHTSGLENSLTLPMQEWHQLLPYLRSFSVQATPGKRYDYSDWGYVALGALVEIASGEDYFDFVKRRILVPAGMVASDAIRRGGEPLPANAAVGYRSVTDSAGLRFLTAWHEVRGADVPYGIGYTSATDLHRLLSALLDGRLLSPPLVREMIGPRRELSADRYGLGIMHFLDGRMFGHSGGDDVLPMDAWMLQYAGTDYRLVVLSNLRPDNQNAGSRVLRKMLELIDAARTRGARQ